MPATRVDGQTNHIATNIIARKAPISAPTTRFPAITTLTTNASSAMESASGAIAAAISKRAHGEWPCMHIPAARWPHASVRLAIWRENSPVKYRRSCKRSCANVGGHDGSNLDWYFHYVSF